MQGSRKTLAKGTDISKASLGCLSHVWEREGMVYKLKFTRKNLPRVHSLIKAQVPPKDQIHADQIQLQSPASGGQSLTELPGPCQRRAGSHPLFITDR